MAIKDPEFMVPKEVAELLRCSVSTAYKIMAKINKDRADKGFIVLRGKVPRKALLESLGI